MKLTQFKENLVKNELSCIGELERALSLLYNKKYIRDLGGV